MLEEKPDNFTDDPFAPDDTPALGLDGAADAPPRRRMPWLWMALAAVALALFTAVWLRWFNPVATDAVERGYIVRVERRGTLFKTFEGEMVTRAALDDTARMYRREFTFSVPDDSLALALRELQGTGREVTVEYRRYAATVPWRGASTNIVTNIKHP